MLSTRWSQQYTWTGKSKHRDQWVYLSFRLPAYVSRPHDWWIIQHRKRVWLALTAIRCYVNLPCLSVWKFRCIKHLRAYLIVCRMVKKFWYWIYLQSQPGPKQKLLAFQSCLTAFGCLNSSSAFYFTTSLHLPLALNTRRTWFRQRFLAPHDGTSSVESTG